ERPNHQPDRGGAETAVRSSAGAAGRAAEGRAATDYQRRDELAGTLAAAGISVAAAGRGSLAGAADRLRAARCPGRAAAAAREGGRGQTPAADQRSHR